MAAFITGFSPRIIVAFVGCTIADHGAKSDAGRWTGPSTILPDNAGEIADASRSCSCRISMPTT
jgi:hypothetical protein